VEHDTQGGAEIPTFLSAYSAEKAFWVDSRIYEYLMAKFVIDKGGAVSEPTLLTATLARQVEPDGLDFPSDYSAGYQRFEPKQTVYLSIGVADMAGGETLEVRWFQGDRQVFQQSKPVEAGDGWYSFSVRNRNGMPQDKYKVEVYLDGELEKTRTFEVKSSK
jgi:hypothetical protein